MRKISTKDVALLNAKWRQALKKIAKYPRFAKHGKIAPLLAEAYMLGYMEAPTVKSVRSQR